MEQYNWNGILYYADVLIQKGILKEDEIKKIIDIVDIKKIVKYNKLSDKFIEKYIIPRIDLDDYEGISIYDIKKFQSNLQLTSLNLSQS
jgi:hypothetical protein